MDSQMEMDLQMETFHARWNETAGRYSWSLSVVVDDCDILELELGRDL